MADHKESWDKLNELAVQWFYLPEAGNEASKQALAEQLFAGVLALVPSRLVDALGDFWLEDWRMFDPNQGTFSGFVNARLRWRIRDQEHKDRGQRRLDRSSPEAGETKTYWEDRAVSLNAPVGDGSGDELGHRLADAEQDRDRMIEGMLLAALALTLGERFAEGKGEHSRYFPLFFTGGIADLVQKDDFFELSSAEEKELFSAMRLPFLDFFMAEECRCLAAIRQAALKTYGELVKGRGAEETRLPLPNDVYISYLKQVEQYPVSPSAISLQKAAYREFGQTLDILF